MNTTNDANTRKIYYLANEVADLCSITNADLVRIAKQYQIAARQTDAGPVYTESQADDILQVSRLEKKSKAELIIAMRNDNSTTTFFKPAA